VFQLSLGSEALGQAMDIYYHPLMDTLADFVDLVVRGYRKDDPPTLDAGDFRI
jgi:hypothetical protein